MDKCVRPQFWQSPLRGLINLCDEQLKANKYIRAMPMA